MKKIKKAFMAGFILAAMYSFYHLGSNLLADIVPMTDEQYARAAQELVNESLWPCQFSSDRSTKVQ